MQEMVSKGFNAQTWMDVILQIFNVKQESIKGFNPMLVASMKSVQVSQDFQIHLEKAVTEATKFASMHVKKIELTNKN